MFKVSYVSSVDGLKEARDIMEQIYRENPKHWPYGLTPEHFDGGIYLIRDKQANNKAVGFAGWQERNEVKALHTSTMKEAGSPKVGWFDNMAKSLGVKVARVGYYSIGILPQYRRNGFAKEALTRLIQMKSAGVDMVRALIASTNNPSIELARSLGVDTQIKQAAYRRAALSQFGLLSA